MGTEESGVTLAVLNGHEVKFNLEEWAVSVGTNTDIVCATKGECIDGNDPTNL